MQPASQLDIVCINYAHTLSKISMAKNCLDNFCSRNVVLGNSMVEKSGWLTSWLYSVMALRVRGMNERANLDGRRDSMKKSSGRRRNMNATYP